MYTIQKSKMFQDKVKFSDEEKELIVDVRLNLNIDLLSKSRSLLLKIEELQRKGNPKNENDIQSLGGYIVEFMLLFFGKNETDKIIKFYENNETLMVTDIFPYIVNVIIPQAEKFAKDRKKQFRKK